MTLLTNVQQQGPRVTLKVIRMMTSMTPIAIAVLPVGMEPMIPMMSMKKPIAAIPVRYNGLRPTLPMSHMARPVATMLTDWIPMLKVCARSVRDRQNPAERQLTKAAV